MCGRFGMAIQRMVRRLVRLHVPLPIAKFRITGLLHSLWRLVLQRHLVEHVTTAPFGIYATHVIADLLLAELGLSCREFLLGAQSWTLCGADLGEDAGLVVAGYLIEHAAGICGYACGVGDGTGHAEGFARLRSPGQVAGDRGETA